MNISAPIIEIAVMAGIASLIGMSVVVDRASQRRRRVAERLTRYCLNPEETTLPQQRSKIFSRIVAVVIIVAQPFVAALFGRERDRIVVRQLLWSAGFRAENAVSMLAAVKTASAIACAVAVFAFVVARDLLASGTMIDAIVVAGGAIVGSIIPEYALRSMASRRRDEMRSNLPDAIDLMVIAAQAGLSLDMAMDRVRREMHSFAPALAGEFSITMAELQALPDRTEAFQNLGNRIGVKEVQSFALTLMQTVRYGTPFAKSLKALGTDLRQARMIALEERGAKLPALLSLPLILFIMPSLFVVVVGPAIMTMMDNFN